MATYLTRDNLARLFAVSEASYAAGWAAIVAATDGLRHISVDASEPVREIIANDEMTGNRGGAAPISGALGAKQLDLLLPLVGSGTATTPPDMAPLLKACGFTETVGGSDVTYARDPLAATAGEYSAALQLVNADKSAGDFYGGVAVQSIEIPALGTQGARVQVRAQATRQSAMQRTVVGTGGITNVATSLPLAANHGMVHNGIDFPIEVTDGVNTERMKVTAIDTTVTPNVATVARSYDSGTAYSFVAGDTIRAFVPSSFTVSSQEIIGDRLGSLTVDGADLEFYDGTLRIPTGHEHDRKPAFESYPQRVVVTRYGPPELEVNIPLLGNSLASLLRRKAEDQSNVAIVLTIGSVAGNRLVVNMPTARVRFSAPRNSEGLRKATVIFSGYATTGADMTLVFS